MEKGEGLLSSCRVLDLTDARGFLCGKILADLGADVVKIERPGGDRSRNLGPFYHGVPDPQRNLHWFAYNLNKRGVTLDIESPQGKPLLEKLVRTADFIIESFSPGYLDGLGAGYSTLSQINPRLIMTSITPYGQTGPRKDHKASDIVVMAMGGLVYITGNPGQPPLRISLPQAFVLASAHAAAASMVAYYHRESSGEGQHVDVSAQQCVLWEVANTIPLWELNGTILRRAGSYMAGRWTGTKQRLMWQCRDGYVLFYILGGAFGAKTNRAIVKWMEEENIAPDYLSNFNWNAFDMASQTQEMQDQIEEQIGKLFIKFTKEELYTEAQKRGIMLCPVSTARDILENEQLKSRNFWAEIEHPELSENILYPGAFARLSETPVTIRRRAPTVGEHNLEIYRDELGLSDSELAALKQARAI